MLPGPKFIYAFYLGKLQGFQIFLLCFLLTTLNVNLAKSSQK
jgi:hypothetical protein